MMVKTKSVILTLLLIFDIVMVYEFVFIEMKNTNTNELIKHNNILKTRAHVQLHANLLKV